MNSVDMVKEICKERNIPISKLERECGFSNGYIRSIKKGMFPADRMKKIADYLGVNVSDLMENTDVQNIGQHGEYYLNEDARELAQFLMENPAYKELFDASRKVKASDIVIVKQLLDRFGGDDNQR